MDISGMRTGYEVGKHVLMNNSVNCRHIPFALSNKLCSWEYRVILLKRFTVKIMSYCPEYKCRFSKQRYLFLYLIQSRMRFGTCSTSFDSAWKGNEVHCIHHNFTLCQDIQTS